MGRSMWTGMAIAGAVALLLSGCDGGGGDPPATTVPSAPASSAADPTSPSASAPATSAEPSETQEDKDFAEAAHAIEEANRIIDEVLMEPDKHKKYPKELKKYVDPASPYWDYNQFGLDQYRKEGKRFSGTTTIAALSLVVSSGKDELTVYRCTDGRDLKVLDKDGSTLSKGSLNEAHIIVRRSAGGRWRVWDYKKNDEGKRAWPVESCDRGDS